MNILLSTFGQTWQIVPEIIGLVNPQCVPLFDNYPAQADLFHFRELTGNAPVDEVWLILTNDQNSLLAFNKVDAWYQMLPRRQFVLKKFVCQSASQLADANECRAMSDYIMRVVLSATQSAHDGNLLLSLAGGRKTMSADLQRAAMLFGCKTLFHVADNLSSGSLLRRHDLNPAELTIAFQAEEIAKVFPVVVSHNVKPGIVSVLPEPLVSKHYPVDSLSTTLLLTEVEKREQQTGNLLHNAYIQWRHSNPSSYFHGLQLLPPQVIHELETQKIGINPQSGQADLLWLQSLPKAELHCHLGGVLHCDGMIGAALANSAAVEQACSSNPPFKQWLNDVKIAVAQHNIGFFDSWRGKWKEMRKLHPKVTPSTTVSAFLSAFKPDPPFLELLLFDHFLDPVHYCGIGITHYEALGDLQGSALLGSEAALRYTLQYLIGKCANEHIIYCEVRCSPAKYASPEMPIQEVMHIIRQELSQSLTTHFKLIIIASRHAPLTEIEEHVGLVSSLVGESEFDDWFAGFDLAGDEAKMTPGELRDVFDPLLRDCVNVTIHAGEDAPVNNIWEAAYLLNADRIGHGLSLRNDPRLMKRFADRGIAIEMCPSSNFQIIGFADSTIAETAHLATYPLRFYMDQNLTVTINTDNPGISRTSLSHEYLKAARMTPGGLSKWEILQLVRNGFKTAFISRGVRKQLMLEAEEQLLKFLAND